MLTKYSRYRGPLTILTTIVRWDCPSSKGTIYDSWSSTAPCDPSISNRNAEKSVSGSIRGKEIVFVNSSTVPSTTVAPSTPALSILMDVKTVSADDRSEEHTSELQSLMRISYAVFCLKKKKTLLITKTQITQYYY